MQIAPTCSHAFFDWRCLKIRALISSSKPALPSHRRTGLMSSLFNPEAPRLCGDTCLAYSACGDTCQAASLKGRGAQSFRFWHTCPTVSNHSILAPNPQIAARCSPSTSCFFGLAVSCKAYDENRPGFIHGNSPQTIASMEPLRSGLKGT